MPTDLGYLTMPPEGRGQAPRTTRPQHLPLDTLSSRDFERLCHRLTELNAKVIQARFYGVPGQAQAGIDLYATKADGSYLVVQCKRSADGFTPKEITAAVDAFLKGLWAKTAQVFVLAVSASLDRTPLSDRIEVERARLLNRGIDLVIWASQRSTAC